MSLLDTVPPRTSTAHGLLTYSGDVDRFWDEVGDVAVVAFDLGGVLVAGGPVCPASEPACWAAVAERFGASGDAVEETRRILWDGWTAPETGTEVAGGPEWPLWERAAAPLGVRGHVLEAFVSSLVHASPPGVRLLTSATSRGVTVGIASNHSPEMTARWRERFGFLGHVRLWGLSFVLGARKPDPVFYKLLVGAARVEPSRIAFIDDRPENVGAAAACGLVAVHAPALAS